jgi:hypothetical protein
MLQVIAIPATDLGGPGSNANLTAIRNTLSVKFIMTKMAKVKKEAGTNQHALLKWLTDVNENAHFDRDAVLGNDADGNTVSSVLNQTTIQ